MKEALISSIIDTINSIPLTFNEFEKCHAFFNGVKDNTNKELIYSFGMALRNANVNFKSFEELLKTQDYCEEIASEIDMNRLSLHA